ncbi:serine carboxypeptidase [Russula ochroleuca]|uniref:Carboxypeptidase n=1 Tax=Russula ochroleuca TaxID=152965 RepID=A0A9P5MWL9_9AGAM|nr:serine carboxypeptidase [Russula ochroleuca]
MLLRSVLVAIFALPALISGNQFPIANGAIGGVPSESPDACNFKSQKGTFSNDDSTPGQLRVVENSGVCETSPDVYQASGYGDLTSADKSIWFWFFAARNDPDTAPLITWFNGGPGSSSMLGLFQELGPCRINNDSTEVYLNPRSWNEVANVLFIDQPAGTGFSYGIENVDTSEQAAVDVWEFLQIWFADSRFDKYASRDFGIWTESYGGHFGPTFAADCGYFLEQNAAIESGTVEGVTINLKVLGIGNGITDALSQYPGYLEYALSNPYHPLVNLSVVEAAYTAWSEGGCRDQIIECSNGGDDSVCSAAQNVCQYQILYNLYGIWDVYYVPTDDPDPYPPALDSYLNSQAVTSKIGSQNTCAQSNEDMVNQFALTGDYIRSKRSYHETVTNAGVRTVLYDGDADFICNYMGFEAMIDTLDTLFSSLYAEQDFANYTVDGELAGLYKNAGTFSYLRVYGAGHEVPAYMWRDVPRGAAALQMFTQIMSDQPLSGT